ncbi:uncharacterized protein LOC135226022 [Macrobrachium nipponense]|uniref:uncharacterized protein LOC135226022 n=1 Tax=Macrobrachium nipponense TaxID=159736 RepID=UPI0030C7F5D2
MEEEINNRIQCDWNNWRKVSGVICDRKVPIRLKGRVHKAVVRPAMTYGLEAAPLKKTEGKKLNVTEMRILRWMSGVTKKDKVRNEHIRGTAKVTDASKKVQEERLRFVWPPDEKRRATHGKRSNVRGGGWNTKERKT